MSSEKPFRYYGRAELIAAAEAVEKARKENPLLDLGDLDAAIDRLREAVDAAKA